MIQKTYLSTEQKIDELVKEVEQRKDFEMFSVGGNTYVRKLILSVFTKIRGKAKFGPQECEKYIRERKKKVPEKYSEVWDSEPSRHIDDYANQMLELCGYQPM
jgi:hypothetical protein